MAVTGSKALDYTALVIAVIGAVNWGLIGLFRLDLVAMIFGQMSLISRIIYVLVGICGLYLLTFFFIPSSFRRRRRHSIFLRTADTDAVPRHAYSRAAPSFIFIRFPTEFRFVSLISVTPSGSPA